VNRAAWRNEFCNVKRLSPLHASAERTPCASARQNPSCSFETFSCFPNCPPLDDCCQMIFPCNVSLRRSSAQKQTVDLPPNSVIPAQAGITFFS
jgi:hypothetical protein